VAVFVADEQGALPVDIDQLRRLADHVLTDQQVPEAMELAVLCIDAQAMAELNHRHMGKTGPTDVLAFPIDLPGEPVPGEPALLGDVVLCPEVAETQAREHDHPAQSELELLLVHGILHLLGHDHGEPDERTRMFTLTERLLSEFRERR
jgi:probable rRNA maturation factor